jgi:hypothetical protein
VPGAERFPPQEGDRPRLRRGGRARNAAARRFHPPPQPALSDSDFKGALVHRSLAVTTILAVAVAALVADDVWLRTHPTPPKYFFVDDKHPPRAAAALDSPIVDDTELLEWTVKAALAPYDVNYPDTQSS